MSRLLKMSVRGIRAFSPYEEIKIEFFRPLTLIQGHNGCGKTVSKNNNINHKYIII
jgi:DNA repair protein RAD50